MSFFKKVVLLCIAVFVVFSGSASAAVHNFDDLGFGNVTVPEGYYMCTRDYCDEELATIFDTNNLTHSSFVQNMENDMLYLYAMNKSGGSIYVRYEDLYADGTPDNSDGTRTHRLMKDYNPMDTKERQDAITNHRDSVAKSGASVTDVSWVEIGESEVTPFIYTCYSDANGVVADYHTIYNGNKISVSFASSNPFTNEKLKEYEEYIKQLTFSYQPDYSELEDIKIENEKIRLEKENKVDKDKSWFRIIAFAVVALAIIVAIIMAVVNYKKKRL